MAAGWKIAIESAFELRINLIDGDGGEKAEASQIDGEEWNIAAPDGARSREKRAIATEYDHQLRVFGHFFPGDGVREPGIHRALRVEAHGDAAAGEPPDDL